MKSFGNYLSKYLASFAAIIFVLLLVNGLAFGWTFQNIFTEDYGEISPKNMLEATAASSTAAGISSNAVKVLQDNHIWAMYLDSHGNCVWSANLPPEIPKSYTIQNIAVFSKGYLADYPVFIRNMEDGLLVLGYPKTSYVKLTSNYYPMRAIKTLPIYAAGTLVIDLVLLFLAYFFSKRKIIKNTEPIVASINSLSQGNPVSLSIHGDLSGIADSINKASEILSRQNQTRANWISGVSHDIRTPLSMIMGYAQRISCDEKNDHTIREQAGIIRNQSIKIKELVQDFNLVSALEYEMQPLHKEPVHLARLVRSYVADLLNAGFPDTFTITVEITPSVEIILMECDPHLFLRAIGNLVQNSIRHNPQGCAIRLSLDCTETEIRLTVADNGVGFSSKKLQELEQKPHYMESTDESPDLRHGLGLLIVRQITEAHGGAMQIENELPHGCKITLTLPKP